ncbi:MAG: ArsR family transcriptional regulator [Saprospirales bacterium]|nr:ArsR family transcriptional regulator [Saprospirales bacterium]
MTSREMKNEVYSTIAGIAKAFSNPNRLEILDLLSNGEKSVEEVAAQTAISFANASQHLQVLKKARLVRLRKDGNKVIYSLANRKVAEAWTAIKNLAETVEPTIGLTLQQYRRARQTDQSICLTELDSARYQLLDVRPAGEYHYAHLPGALSIPVNELELRLAELPKEKTIVAYCRGTYCTMADAAVQLLRSRGFNAVRLEESPADASNPA